MKEITHYNHCNSKAYRVQIDRLVLYFSYDTLIGLSIYGENFRIKNSWGPTTGKHFNEFGLKDVEVVDNLENLVEYYLLDYGQRKLEAKLGRAI